ncbi:hypothetical protein OG875_02630 [Streptomyces sp. NBC_01498]|uniref:hypothetical protein n=1 Tax=Streptomyces sp. NBC_01498 TaxID=2975870 RepID=UPI002E7B52E0|nr:hypothetical protein [Streptomyces sp. NBC_01498]WTL23594.1 hypothetical protein OG875_02630 [Streptomyces sp. NBC_01498]
MGTVLSLASPASAAVVQSECTTTQKVVGTPGDDLYLDVRVCVQKDSTGVYRAEATFDWEHGGYAVDFEKLQLHLRLEKYDVVQKGAVCDFKDEVNNINSGIRPCQVPWSSASSPLTADATMVYNHNNDGQGDYSTDFTGSPSI